ncbi:MAG: hypothetical protein Q8939_02090 [Bacteroidota bacterium]|nr:hypothetical protein [Bacteroidota bacterium]
MKLIPIIFFCSLFSCVTLCAQDSLKSNRRGFLEKDELSFLKGLTRAVLENARLYPGRSGNNKTGGVLIRPGGDYPSFWIRDYAMSLETGMIGRKEQEHMLLLTASSQCDQTWITEGGSLVPYGAIADHIRPEDGLPIFFPGTYSYQEQGVGIYGKTPPYDDQYYFIHMGYYYVKNNDDKRILEQEVKGIKLIERMEIAFQVPPCHAGNGIVYTTDNFRGVDFGFRDAEEITGDLCFTSILKYRASKEMAELSELMGNKSKSESYRNIAEKIKKALPVLFADNRGMLRASTGKSGQADVWSTALAVYFGMLNGKRQQTACEALAHAYENKSLAFKGSIRHVLTTDDFNDTTSWEYSLSAKNTYQNGAYWGTPTGWVCYAIAKVDKRAARNLKAEYIEDLRETDFRKGKGFGGPYECFYPPDYKQNPVYLTTVSCPYGVFRRMKE